MFFKKFKTLDIGQFNPFMWQMNIQPKVNAQIYTLWVDVGSNKTLEFLYPPQTPFHNPVFTPTHCL